MPPDTAIAKVGTNRTKPVVLNSAAVKAVSTRFLAAMDADFQQHGAEAIRRFRKQSPGEYVKCFLELSKIVRIEIGEPGEFDRARSKEEIVVRLEERYGSAARQLFERFTAQLEQLEQADARK